MNCDVVIVGAGPAGSTAAKELAKAGINVVVVEKKQEIGCPKRCAEGISCDSLSSSGTIPDPRWAVNRIYGASLHAPSGKRVDINSDRQLGWVLERKIFEKFLAADAIKKGARYLIRTTAVSVILGDGVKGILANNFGKEIKISSKVVVAADGVESKIARSAGIPTSFSPSNYRSCFQYEMGGVSIDEKRIHLYFGKEIAPKGYIWIFPKGGGIANVGCGIEPGKLKAKEYLDRFIDLHPEIFASASPIEMNAGGVPVGSSIPRLVDDGILIVGDAAHLASPIHGGGISNAILSARIASDVIVNALKREDLSAGSLRDYERRWRLVKGEESERLLKLRKDLERMEDEELNRLSESLSGEKILDLISGKHGTRLL